MKFKSGRGNDQLVPLLVQIWFNFSYDTNTLLHYITPLLVSHCYYYKHLKVTTTISFLLPWHPIWTVETLFALRNAHNYNEHYHKILECDWTTNRTVYPLLVIGLCGRRVYASCLYNGTASILFAVKFTKLTLDYENVFTGGHFVSPIML